MLTPRFLFLWRNIMDTELLKIIIATIFGWVLHGVVSYLMLRKTIRSYLLIVIPSLTKDFRVCVDQMDSFMSSKVQLNNKIVAAPIHRSNLDILACIKVDAIKVLSNNEVKKFTHFYIALYHLDCLLRGFSDHLVKYEDKVIDGEIIRHLTTHVERAKKIVEQFPDENDLLNINDLPKNFHFLHNL